MSKQAYLIISSFGINELIELIRRIDYSEHDIYIHIDKKNKNVNIEKIRSVCKKSSMFFVDRRRVAWGGFSQIDCELRLLEAATKNYSYKYYHLLSGRDYLVNNAEKTFNFFEKQSLNFIAPPKYGHGPKKVRMRYEQYHLLQDSLIGKKRDVWKYIDFASCYIQKYIGIRRFKNQDMLFTSQWFSITVISLVTLFHKLLISEKNIVLLIVVMRFFYFLK